MVAKIKLEAENDTGQGFDELLKDVEAVGTGVESLDQRTKGWNVTTHAATSEAQQEFRALRMEVQETLETVNRLEEQRQEVVRETAKEHGILAQQVSKVGTAAAGGAAAAVEGYVKWKLTLFGVKKGLAAVAVAAGGALGSAAAAALPAVQAYLVLKTTVEGVKYALAHTGQEIRALGGENGRLISYSKQTTETIAEQTGVVARNNRELARALQATYGAAEGQKKLNEVLQATGKTAEELGVEASSNLTKWGDALSDAGGDITQPFIDSKDAIVDWWNSSNVLEPVIKEFDELVTEMTDNGTENVRSLSKAVGDSFDNIKVSIAVAIGANEEQYRREIKNLRELKEEHKRLEKARKLTKDDYKRLGDFNRGLEYQTKLTAELNRLGSLRSSQIDAEENKLRAAAGEAAARNEFSGRTEAEYTQKMQILAQRRVTAHKEELAEREAAQREFDEKRKRASEEFARWEEQQRREHERERKAEREAARKLQEDTKKALYDYEIEKKNLLLDSIKWKAEQDVKAIDEEIKKREEANEDFEDLEEERKAILRASLDFRKMQLANELAMVKNNAKSEIEVRRAVLNAKVQAARMEQQLEQSFEERKVQQTQRAERARLQARLDAHNKLKEALQERKETGGSAAQNLIRNLNPRAVRDQMIANRIAAARQRPENQNLSSYQQRQLDTKTRRGFFRDARQGRLDVLELRKAQSQQAARVLTKARADGRLNQAQVRALATATNELLKLERTQIELEREVDKIEQQLQNGGRRARSQRAGR